MKRLLLVLAFGAARLCDAGITIHYEGSARDSKSVDAILAETTSFAKARGWRIEPIVGTTEIEGWSYCRRDPMIIARLTRQLHQAMPVCELIEP